MITGAAAGLGRCLAKAFAAQGAQLCLLDRDEQGLETVSNELGGHQTYVIDLADTKNLSRNFSAVYQKLGSPDVIVLNAGVALRGPFLDYPIEKHLHLIEVNLNANLILISEVLKSSLSAGLKTHIVVISSISAFNGFPLAASYGASKSALHHFVEALETEYPNTHFTRICPAYLNTEMFKDARPLLGTRILQADKLAQTILKAVKSKKRLVICPAHLRWIIALKLYMPDWLWKLLLKTFRVNS